MFRLVVGVGHVSLHFRQARSLKDKRQVLKSIAQKLRNEGFSVVEDGDPDEMKRGSLGFAFVGTHTGGVNKRLDEAQKYFLGPFEIIETKRETFDYSGEDEGTLSEEEDLKYGL